LHVVYRKPQVCELVGQAVRLLRGLGGALVREVCGSLIPIRNILLRWAIVLRLAMD
jgi:hypothetical protein